MTEDQAAPGASGAVDSDATPSGDRPAEVGRAEIVRAGGASALVTVKSGLDRIAFLAANTPVARSALKSLTAQFDNVPLETADVIVALGGDGFLLENVHRYLHLKKPFFGMNCGTVGFLLNPFSEDLLRERLNEAVGVLLHPLRMRTFTEDCMEPAEDLAFNEVSLLRETRQAAKLRITVDGVVRLDELVCDGALVSTPAGSTAYNMSVHGPILPLGAGLLALTPISAFRPRRWRGALLPHGSRIRFDILEPDKRPVSAVADFTEVRDVSAVEVYEDAGNCQSLLFDPGHDLEERIVKEQFMP